VADRLGLPIDQVEIVHGDTGKIPFGMDLTPRARWRVGGTALVKAMDKIVAKGQEDAGPSARRPAEGISSSPTARFAVAGTGRAVSFAQSP